MNGASWVGPESANREAGGRAVVETERPEDHKRTLGHFDPAVACRHIDERFEEMVWVRAVD